MLSNKEGLIIKLYYESKPGELEHGLFGSTKKRANARYIHKIKMANGKFRYFYTAKEWDRYNAAKNIVKGIKAVSDEITGKRVRDETESAKKAMAKAKMTGDQAAYEKAKRNYKDKKYAMDKQIGKVGNTIKDVVTGVKTASKKKKAEIINNRNATKWHDNDPDRWLRFGPNRIVRTSYYSTDPNANPQGQAKKKKKKKK